MKDELETILNNMKEKINKRELRKQRYSKPLTPQECFKPKKEKTNPHVISTKWEDLKKAAEHIGVPISTIVKAKEDLKTNNKQRIFDYIKLNNFVKENETIEPIIITVKGRRNNRTYTTYF